MGKRRHEPFAQTVARIKSQPVEPEPETYALVDRELSSERVLELASSGAQVVYDSCGCGGTNTCTLDWLSDADVRALVRSRVGPRKRAKKHGYASMEHWRSTAGHDLVVLAVDVSWGDRIG